MGNGGELRAVACPGAVARTGFAAGGDGSFRRFGVKVKGRPDSRVTYGATASFIGENGTWREKEPASGDQGHRQGGKKGAGTAAAPPFTAVFKRVSRSSGTRNRNVQPGLHRPGPITDARAQFRGRGGRGLVGEYREQTRLWACFNRLACRSCSPQKAEGLEHGCRLPLRRRTRRPARPKAGWRPAEPEPHSTCSGLSPVAPVSKAPGGARWHGRGGWWCRPAGCLRWSRRGMVRRSRGGGLAFDVRIVFFFFFVRTAARVIGPRGHVSPRSQAAAFTRGGQFPSTLAPCTGRVGPLATAGGTRRAAVSRCPR